MKLEILKFKKLLRNVCKNALKNFIQCQLHTLSLFRKSIYFLSVVLIPLLTGVTNVFFAETVSDFAGPVFSIILFLLVFKKVVGDPKQISVA